MLSYIVFLTFAFAAAPLSLTEPTLLLNLFILAPSNFGHLAMTAQFKCMSRFLDIGSHRMYSTNVLIYGVQLK